MNADDYQKQATRTENTPLFIDHERRRLIDHGIDPRVANVTFAAAARADQVLSRLMHAVLGMITELGEFCDPLKKCLIYGKPYDATNLQEELGDSEWYVALAANALEAQLVDIFERNIAKLRVRYPDKFTEQHALNRDLDAERKVLEAGAPAAWLATAALEGEMFTESQLRSMAANNTGTINEIEAWLVQKSVNLLEEIERLREVAKAHDLDADVPRDPAALPSSLPERLRLAAKGTFANIQFQVAGSLRQSMLDAAKLLEDDIARIDLLDRARIANYRELCDLRDKIRALGNATTNG